MIKKKMEWPDLRELIITTAEQDGRGIRIILEEQGQQMAFIQDLKREPRLRSYSVQGVRLSGSKLAKAMPWVSRMEEMAVCDAPWTIDFFDECESFSADDTHAHEDQIDATSLGFAALNKGQAVFAHRRMY